MIPPVFLACWALFVQLRGLLDLFLISGAEVYYGLTGKSLRLLYRDEMVVFRSLVNPPFEASFSALTIHANTPFLWTLMLVIPGMAWNRKLLSLAGATVLLYLTQLAFLVTKIEIALVKTSHPLAGTVWFWTFLDDFFEIVGKIFFPIAIWLIFATPYLMGYRDPRKPHLARPPGRNDPCPCGSGKKFKKCCGR